MVNTNKILTVSYGTFSCTLEGFDDSFGTMKAIAEYFRDLASDDRYFGAEPPTPDAEMLARIAEREIARRVEAHFEENKIVLRADPGSTLPVAARAAMAATPIADQEQKQDQDEIADQVAAETENEVSQDLPVAQAKVEAEVEEESETENEDLTALPTAAQLTAEDAPAVDFAAAYEADEAEEDGIAEDLSGLRALVADSQAAAPADDNLAETPEEASGEIYDEEYEDETATEAAVASQPLTPTQHIDPDSVAAKLQRIRAVVSQQETEAPAAYTEDEHAEDFLAETHGDIEDALEIDDAVQSGDFGWDATEEQDGISGLLDRLTGDDAFDEVDEDEPADLSTEAAAEDETDDATDDAESRNQADELAEEPVAAPIRARVIKMKRADFEAAIADGHLEEDLDDSDDEPSSLSPDQEAELLRELAEVEAELDDSDLDDTTDEAETDAEDEDEAENLFQPDDFDAQEPTPAAARSERRSRLEKTDAEREMGRILAETNNQLDEETGKGRRNAIAHLRAAVEATKAERGAGGDLTRGEPDTGAYRNDLANVVRPRRPHAVDSADHRTRRPDAPRPAPLKLVAEQRVDLEASAEHAPIRPRRVSLSPQQAEATVDADDFAEYAETVGASSLPELLEAAAAYLAFVEGREQFSRPQLMTRVRQVEQDEFSREDGLRSFGQLLREGKIVKIKGGRFAASETISYRPDARYAGE